VVSLLLQHIGTARVRSVRAWQWRALIRRRRSSNMTTITRLHGLTLAETSRLQTA